ncbi:MAG: magnesium transporter, partial [Pirellulales bacterium]
NTLYLPEIREMLADQNAAELGEFCTALHPARTAEYMEGLTAAECWEVLRHTSPAMRANIFSYLDLDKQVQVIETVDRGEIVHLVIDLAPDERVDILERVDPLIRDQILTLLPAEDRRNILRLSTYPEGTAGSMMTTQFARLSEAWTVNQALDELRRQKEDHETIYYLYVVDEGDHLRGLISLRELVFAQPNARIGALMERAVVQVDVIDDQEEVANKMAQYDFLAIPVVDHERHLVGIVTYDDVMDVVREEATEDAQRSAAIEPLSEGYLETPLLSLTWKRGLWLVVLFFVSLGTAWTLGRYEATVAAVPWLVFFIPLVISTGGNSGGQSAALIINALSTGDITLRDWFRVVKRELLSGLLLGGILASIGFLAALTAAPNLAGAFVLPLTVILVVTSGTLTGSLLPLLFHRLGWDPALMSNPMVACIIDFLGIVIYLTVAICIVRP